MIAPAIAPTAAPSTSTASAVAVLDLSSASTTTVVRIASVIPAAETWLPRRAVAGEFIRCRPITKQTADSR